MDAAASTGAVEPGLEMTQFSDESNDSTVHFQILRLIDQVRVQIPFHCCCTVRPIHLMFAMFESMGSVFRVEVRILSGLELGLV